MDDLGKILAVLVTVYRAIVGFFYSVGVSSSIEAGYFFVAFAIGLAIYRHRRSFYIHNDLDSDFDPSYSKVMRRSVTDFVLELLNITMWISAALVLSKQYIPEIFYGVFGVLLPK
jgi:hypothetical protein